MTHNSIVDNITIERLEEIERQRNSTYADAAFQRWMQDLKVASRYVDKTLIYNASMAMQEWDVSRFRLKTPA